MLHRRHRWLSILVRPEGGASNQMRPVQIWEHFYIAGVYDPIENEYWTGAPNGETVRVSGETPGDHATQLQEEDRLK